MYHDIWTDGHPVPEDRAWFSVPATEFRLHLQRLGSLSRPGQTLTAALGSGATAITFDDGMLSDYSAAFPALLEHGMSATFYVVSDLVGRPGRASWDQLREMADAGMEIQSHTHTHPFLSELDQTQLREELVRSRKTIEDALGHPVTQLALPGGDLPRREWRSEFAAAGYRVVATSRWGTNAQRDDAEVRWIRRCTVRGILSEGDFAAVVRGSFARYVSRRAHEIALGTLRGTLGASRYARWRRAALGLLPTTREGR